MLNLRMSSSFLHLLQDIPPRQYGLASGRALKCPVNWVEQIVAEIAANNRRVDSQLRYDNDGPGQKMTQRYASIALRQEQDQLTTMAFLNVLTCDTSSFVCA